MNIMDLKLKDEITKLLIESPGISISKLAKKTGNYYSYTHKVVSEMEKEGLLEIEKAMEGKKEVTICRLKEEYKKEWVWSLKKIVMPLLKDVEVKAALAIMYLFLLFTSIGKEEQPLIMAAGRDAVFAEAAPMAGTVVQSAAESSFGMDVIIVLLVPLLMAVWYLRKRKRNS